MTKYLRSIAYVRSGDKGDICNVGVIAREPRFYADILKAVTPESVKKLYGPFVKGEVIVYRLDNIHAVNVVMKGALDGGATRTLRLDQTGKAMGTALLRLEIQD